MSRMVIPKRTTKTECTTCPYSEQIEKCHKLLDSVNAPPSTNDTRAEALCDRLSAYLEIRRDMA